MLKISICINITLLPKAVVLF